MWSYSPSQDGLTKLSGTVIWSSSSDVGRCSEGEILLTSCQTNADNDDESTIFIVCLLKNKLKQICYPTLVPKYTLCSEVLRCSVMFLHSADTSSGFTLPQSTGAQNFGKFTAAYYTILIST